MSRTLAALALVAGFALFTALSQVGGLVLLASAALWRLGPAPRLASRLSAPARVLAAAVLFLSLHAVVSLLVLPPLAARGGRVPLACAAATDADYGPRTRLTCLLNRHYVAPSVRAALARIAARVRARSGGRLAYLDAGFPFADGFPMPPHLSHRHGRDVDLAFFYEDEAGGVAAAPSPIGYFAYEGPGTGEVRPCAGIASRLRWDLEFLQPVMPERRFDRERTRVLVEEILASGAVRRLFVEPHIRLRLGIADARVRFQGCAAARHDDHIHVEFVRPEAARTHGRLTDPHQMPAVMLRICRSPSGIAAPDLKARHRNCFGVPA